MVPTHTHQCLGNTLGLQSQKHVSASNVRGRKNVKTSKASMRIKHGRTHVKVPFKSKRKQCRHRANGTQHTGTWGQQLAPHSVTRRLTALPTALLSPQGGSRLEAKLPPCQIRCFNENENRTMQMYSFQTLHNNRVNTDNQMGRMEKGLHT